MITRLVVFSQFLRRRVPSVLLMLSTLLLLSACATGGQGGYGAGGYPARGAGGYPDSYGSAPIQGTVDFIDRGRIVLVEDGQAGYGGRVELAYDGNTRLYYQGQQLAVQGLERGDGVRVDAVRTNDGLLARSIEVVRNVRDGYQGDRYGEPRYGDPGYGQPRGGAGDGGYRDDYGSRDRYGDGFNNSLRGTVSHVDPRSQMIEIDTGASLGGYGDGARARIRYDQRTLVEFQGRAYRPENLDPGDLVRVQVRQLGRNEWLAERVVVERSVR